jgi:hypothetical protein
LPMLRQIEKTAIFFLIKISRFSKIAIQISFFSSNFLKNSYFFAENLEILHWKYQKQELWNKIRFAFHILLIGIWSIEILSTIIFIDR